MTKEFNKYAADNNLDIRLNLNLFSFENSTSEWDSYDSAMYMLLKKKSIKYDILIYDPLFTRRMSSHFVDLKSVLSQQHLNQYKGDSEKLGKYEDQWVGIVNILSNYL